MSTRAAPAPPALGPGAAAQALLASMTAVSQTAAHALHAPAAAREAVAHHFAALRAQMVRRELSTIPVARLKEVTEGRLRLGKLESAGYSTVLSVFQSTPRQLTMIPGVGDQTAVQAVAAALQVARAVGDGLQVRIDLDPSNQLSTTLLQHVRLLENTEKDVDAARDNLTRLTREIAPLLIAAQPAGSKVRFFFTGSVRKVAAREALAQLQHWAAWVEANRVRSQIGAIAQPTLASPQGVWEDFEKRSPEYYGLLGEIVDLKLDVAAADGFLPSEIVDRIHAQTLDESFRTVSLRGYQSFGARFALVQRNCVIGDEMGLGKTIEAIAAMAHLRAVGKSHFMVVCPASVLINWTREVGQRSKLMPYRVHGAERGPNLRRWVARGGVAVTTFDSLGTLAIANDIELAMLVVDEAHYVKNPRAQRSRAVATWVHRADRTLFLTGTPMENRVEEFRNLIHYLQPAVARAIDAYHGVAGPDAFRKAVAPVYLRRNQVDVLTELPELVQVDEWEEFGTQDFAAYRDAVMSGNFMAMRRAAFAVPDPRQSAKLQRLLEIADEAGENGHKVVVFSYFRDVLDTVHRALGDRAFGPITGSVPPEKRQAIVDAFTQTRQPAVLVSQMQAGGVGLNMQAASVVILCEPQVKPTTEAQAIARAHRMGQVRTVLVHRLLIADSVDQRMLEILDSKRRLFDEYVRRSATAEASPEAVDISEAALAQQIVAAEQERLARELMEQFSAE